MPFEAKFRSAMEFPFSGNVIGGFTIEELEVQHHGFGDGRYDYPIRMVLRGKGGKQGVRNALRELFNAKRTTFSGFGNPYQCWVGKTEVASLGDQRYEVSARGIGVRIFLRQELERFYRHLAGTGHTAESLDDLALEKILDTYMDEYLRGISNASAAYKRKIQRIEKKK